MILILVTLLLCSQQALTAATDVESCMEETGTTYDDVYAWADGEEADEALRCHMKCLMLSTNTLSEDGELHLEPMLLMFPEDQHQIVRECIEIDQAGVDLCDLAYRHNKCLREKSPQFYSEWVRMKFTK